MKTWKKIVLALAAVPVAFVAFATWYFVRYSMGVAEPFEVGTADRREHVLIATQGSAFKDAVVGDVIKGLEPRKVYVKVIDVRDLKDVREAEWSAIVVLHTWEGGRPPAAVQAFVDRVQSRDKLVVLATSGDKDRHIEGVDTITGASSMGDAPARAQEIVRRLGKVLDVGGPQTSR